MRSLADPRTVGKVADMRYAADGGVTSIEDPPRPPRRHPRFHDRRSAGQALAPLLERFRLARPVVLGIPRGGVPVAAAVAHALGAPLDVVIVRKIGAPRNPEFALGALGEGGVRVLDEPLIGELGLNGGELMQLLARSEAELAQRMRRYRDVREPVGLSGRTAIIVDDGLATGRSAQAAVRAVRRRGASQVILAVPVAAPASADALRLEVDEVVCVDEPDALWAVGLWYEDFSPTSDEETLSLLSEGGAAPDIGSALEVEARIAVTPRVELSGDLAFPEAAARGIVAFAHGSGSSRLSPRNRAVARALNDAGFATLLFDLLTPVEEVNRRNVFDVALLTSRLVAASSWLRERQDLGGLPLGYFGASTGAAAALSAAALLGDRVSAVVCRGGRPDLARGLSAVSAPTLLIVGGADEQVLDLNRHAQRELHCASELAVVAGATHLFEEPGALEQVASLASGWFESHLAANEDWW